MFVHFDGTWQLGEGTGVPPRWQVYPECLGRQDPESMGHQKQEEPQNPGGPLPFHNLFRYAQECSICDNWLCRPDDQSMGVSLGTKLALSDFSTELYSYLLLHHCAL